MLAPAWIVALGLAALVATRALEDDSNKYLAMLHAQTVWVYLPAYGICVAAVLFRHKTLAIVAAIAVCAHVFLVFESAGPAAHVPAVFDAPLRVVTSNVRYNNPEPEALARELLSYNADVLLLQHRFLTCRRARTAVLSATS